MPKLIVKPTINFLSTETDPQLAVSAGVIFLALDNNPDYPNPTPTLPILRAALAAFTAACSAASLGGKALTWIKNDKRAELTRLMRQLAGYVATACAGDLAKLLESGFPIHKPTRHAIGFLKAPRAPALKHGPKSGQIKASTKPVRGVFIYTWKLMLASEPDVPIQTAQSTGAKTTFAGLTPGQIYIVQVNAVGVAGATDFSGQNCLMSL